MNEPARIYLDQKDFGGIADAIVRNDRASPLLSAYHQLQALVEAGRVRVYFSFVHVVEGLRFGDVRSPLATAYCEVVDRLTAGHCIRFPTYLQHAEVRLAFAALLGIPTSYPDDEYAYGRYADALSTDGLTIDYAAFGISSDSAMEMLEELRTQLLPRVPNRHAFRALLSTAPATISHSVQSMLPAGMKTETFLTLLLRGSDDDRRSLAASMFSNEALMRRMIANLPDSTFDEMSTEYPSAGFTWTRELAVNALFGDPTTKKAILDSFLSGVFTFRNLIGHYSLASPDLSKAGGAFASSETALVNLVGVMQHWEPLRKAILGTPATWDSEISQNLRERYLDTVITEEIASLPFAEGLSRDRAEEVLRKDNLKSLPYMGATTLWIHAYLARHKGTKYPRRPDPNDLRDLLHCVNAPYVDVLVTERFAAEVSRTLADAFGTRIVRSLPQLLAEFAHQ